MYTFQEQWYPGSRNEHLKKLAGRPVAVEVVLGNPRINCAGTGICRINVMPPGASARAKKRRLCCRITRADCYLWSRWEMWMLIKKTSVCKKTYPLFASGRFEIPHPVGLPEEMGRMWNLPPLEVASGHYEVEETLQVFFLALKLQTRLLG